MILGHPLLGAQAEHRVLVQIVSSHNENNYTHLCFVRKRSPRDFFSILLDLFRCESATLRTRWVLVVMDQYTRRIIGFGVHAGTVNGVALCRMFNCAIRWQPCMPNYLSSDHDPLYRFGQWQANLRILEVIEIKTVPYVPLSHPFVERLIGTIRREYLDCTLFWTTADLENKLLDFRTYFNAYRSHTGLEGRTPDPVTPIPRPVARLHSYGWQRHCRGLYHTPMTA